MHKRTGFLCLSGNTVNKRILWPLFRIRTAAFVSCGGELREGWKGVNLGKTAKMLKISLEKWQKWANFAWKSGGMFWWGLIIKWLCLLDWIGEIEKLLFNMGAAWLV